MLAQRARDKLLLSTQTAQNHLEFQAGFGVLGLGIGIFHNSAAGKKRSPLFFQQGRAQSHGKFAIALEINPANGAGIPAAIQILVVADKSQRRSGGCTTDSRCRMQRLQRLQDASPWQKFAHNGGLQVLNIFQAQEFRCIGDLRSRAEAAQRIAQHRCDKLVFRAILLARQQGAAQAAVLSLG